LHHGECITRLARCNLFGCASSIVSDSEDRPSYRACYGTPRGDSRQSEQRRSESSWRHRLQTGKIVLQRSTNADEHFRNDGSGVPVRTQDRCLDGRVQAGLLEVRNGVRNSGQRELEV
jgi:hypothetical protein